MVFEYADFFRSRITPPAPSISPYSTTYNSRPSFHRQIEALLGVSRSTASDICRHALSDVAEKRGKERKSANEPDESEDNGNEEVELKVLIASDCLDPKPRPGGPKTLRSGESTTCCYSPTGI